MKKSLERIGLSLSLVAIGLVIFAVGKHFFLESVLKHLPPPVHFIESAQAKKVAYTEKLYKRSRLLDSHFNHLTALSQGCIEALYKQPGMWVEKGEIVAIIDQKSALEEKEAASSAALVAERFLARMQTLFFQNLLSQEDYEHAQASYLKAKASLKAAEDFYEKTYIRSKMSGYLSDFPWKEGDFIGMGATFASLTNLEQYEALTALGAEDLTKLDYLSEAFWIVQKDSYPIVLSSVEKIVDIQSQQAQLRFALTQKDQSLKSGLWGQVCLSFVFPNKLVWVASQDVLSATVEGPCIWQILHHQQLGKKIAHRIPIKILSFPNEKDVYFEILNSDLYPGTEIEIVQKGHRSLKEGDYLEIL